MNQTNYHSHSLYCDGRAGMEDFVRFAVNRKFSSYGFSSHAPLPFSTPCNMEWDRMDDYLSEFQRLKKKYEGIIELYIGLEIDYIDAETNAASECYQRLPLDYRIGSLHMLPDEQGKIVDTDLPADRFRRMVNERFSGDIENVVRLYYKQLMQMIETGGFDIVGHADKIHYNAACYRPGLTDESWYNTLVYQCFEEIACRGYQMEINTKAYHDLGVFYPDKRYFPLIKELGIKVQVNSDAHYPERIDSGRHEALTLLHQAGFTNIMEMHDGCWQEVEIQL